MYKTQKFEELLAGKAYEPLWKPEPKVTNAVELDIEPRYFRKNPWLKNVLLRLPQKWSFHNSLL